MDFRAILLPIGRFLLHIAALMLLPALADAVAQNPDWRVFVTAACVLGGVGVMIELALRGKPYTFKAREGFLLVNIAWFAFSLAGAMPFYWSELDIDFVDAFFEAASGVTTTGATVLSGLDDMPPGILLWRSLRQWIGGLGIIGIGIMLLPALRIGGQQLFLLESSEKTVNPFGRIVYFARRITGLYLALTLACGLLYYAAGMTGFQAVNHAFTTLATGGFSTSDQSLGHFASLTIDWIAIVFMLVSSLPFLFLITLVEKGRFDEYRQILFFLGLVAAMSLFLFASISADSHSRLHPWIAFTAAVFQVTSIITTTGYATSDYMGWGSFAVTFFFLLIFVGGCNGSTAGGFKIFRIMILLSFVRSRLRVMLRPNRVASAHFEGRRVSSAAIEGVLAFTILYTATFAAFALVYAAFGLDIVTALSASISALANVGPGIGPVIGPAGTFADLPEVVKVLLGVQMILGRLELLGAILVMTPDFWLE